MNFVSEYRIDKRSYIHLCNYVEKKAFWRVALAAAVFLLCMAELLWMGMPMFSAVLSAGVLGYHLYCYHKRGQEYRKLVDSNHGNPPHLVAIMDEDGLRIRNLNKDKHFELGYEEIGSVVCTKWFIHVSSRDRSAVINFDTRAMTEGDGRALLARLEELGHSPKKLRSIRWLQRLIQATSVVCIILGLLLNGMMTDIEDLPNQIMPPMDVRTAAAVLEELGIGGITEEILTEIESYPYRADNELTTLLSHVGWGDYDDETWEWSPAGNGVYAVDMEFLEIGGMYTDYLAGIADIGGGELVFEDVEEDIWIGSGALGYGWKKVSFTLNGKKHTLRPFMNMDWLDIGFADKVAKLVDRADTGKQLYFLYGDDTVFYVFYRDAPWAEAFELKTGYELRTQIG